MFDFHVNCFNMGLGLCCFCLYAILNAIEAKCYIDP